MRRAMSCEYCEPKSSIAMLPSSAPSCSFSTGRAVCVELTPFTSLLFVVIVLALSPFVPGIYGPRGCCNRVRGQAEYQKNHEKRVDLQAFEQAVIVNIGIYRQKK